MGMGMLLLSDSAGATYRTVGHLAKPPKLQAPFHACLAKLELAQGLWEDPMLCGAGGHAPRVSPVVGS